MSAREGVLPWNRGARHAGLHRGSDRLGCRAEISRRASRAAGADGLEERAARARGGRRTARAHRAPHLVRDQPQGLPRSAARDRCGLPGGHGTAFPRHVGGRGFGLGRARGQGRDRGNRSAAGRLRPPSMSMWRPPERIRHDARTGRWPSAAEAAGSLLFQPIRVGGNELKQRTWVPAMVPWRATEDGFVTPNVLAWYERFARGRPGALVVEATGIRDVASGPLLRVGDARFLPGLETLVDTVRRASGGETRLFIQLIDFLSVRRRP